MHNGLLHYIVDPSTKRVVLKTRAEVDVPPGMLLIEQEEDIAPADGIYDANVGKVLEKTDEHKSRERSFAVLYAAEELTAETRRKNELERLIQDVPQPQTRAALWKIVEMLKLMT